MNYFILLLCHLTLVRGDDAERNAVILRVKFRAYWYDSHRNECTNETQIKIIYPQTCCLHII